MRPQKEKLNIIKTAIKKARYIQDYTNLERLKGAYIKELEKYIEQLEEQLDNIPLSPLGTTKKDLDIFTSGIEASKKIQESR